jgi:hypothetical protein
VFDGVLVRKNPPQPSPAILLPSVRAYVHIRHVADRIKL